MEDNKSKSPCDYCKNSQGNFCPLRCCIEYSRWENDGTATQYIINKVEDFKDNYW